MGLLPRVPDMAAWFFKANRRLFSSSLLKWCFMPKIHIIFCHILYCLEEVTGPPVLQLNRSYKKMTHWASSQVCLPCWPNEHHHNFMTKLHDVSTWKLNTYYFIYFPHSCKIFLYKSMHIQIISDILEAFLCQSFFTYLNTSIINSFPAFYNNNILLSVWFFLFFFPFPFLLVLWNSKWTYNMLHFEFIHIWGFLVL